MLYIIFPSGVHTKILDANHVYTNINEKSYDFYTQEKGKPGSYWCGSLPMSSGALIVTEDSFEIPRLPRSAL